MLYRVFAVGLIAGLIGGAALTAVQFWKILPLIAAAEVYEDAAAAESHAHDGAMHDHEAEAAWEPAPGLQRVGLTFLANLIIAVGFGLVMSGGFALRQAFGG